MVCLQHSISIFFPTFRDKENPTRHSRAGLQIVPSLRDWLRRVTSGSFYRLKTRILLSSNGATKVVS